MQWPPPVPPLRSWGDHNSCLPWTRDLGSLVQRWVTCPNHLPKRVDRCLYFWGLAAFATLMILGEALSAVPLEQRTWGFRFQVWQHIPITSKGGWVPVWRFSFPGGVETRGQAAQLPPGLQGQCMTDSFGQLQMWFGTYTPGHAASQGTEVGTCCIQGMCTLLLGRSPMSFVEIDPSILVASPVVSVWTWFGTFALGSSGCDLAHLLQAVLLCRRQR